MECQLVEQRTENPCITIRFLYNSSLMCLQTIGEALKNVDNLTGKNFLKA